MTARYTGFIRKAPDGNGIVGVIRDFCGWPIEITGTPGTVDGVRGYVLTGVLGEPPESMRFRAIDGPAPGEAPA